MASFSSSSTRTMDLLIMLPTAAVLGIAPFCDIRFHAILPELEDVGIWKWTLIEAAGGTRAGTTLPPHSLFVFSLPRRPGGRYRRECKVDITLAKYNEGAPNVGCEGNYIFNDKLENCRGDRSGQLVLFSVLERMNEKTKKTRQ